jgi:hypothetical protein
MAELGKRYECEACETEILCTKASDNIPECCGKEMPIKGARELPSSD